MVISSYHKVIFKNNDRIVYETQASLGCIRYGHPGDTLYLYQQALEHLNTASKEGALTDPTWSSVIILLWTGGLIEYSKADITQLFLKSST